MTQGLFISFEGGEGSGKTTQINRLAKSLTSDGNKVVTVRDPGDTPEGEKIRALIVQRESGDWTPTAEILLFFAARTMLTEKVILPALKEGKIVISDRFFDSTLAYQGYGRGVSLEKIEALNRVALDNFSPDLTFVLDIDPEVGIERSERRLASEALGLRKTEDRFERLNLSFHKDVRRGFLEIADSNPERCHVLDATLTIEDMAQIIKDITLERLHGGSVR